MNIGEKTIAQDSNYGSYVFTCVGLIDLIDGNNKEAINFNDVSHWMSEYHPKHFFRSYVAQKFDSVNPWKFYVSIVLESDNKDWAKNNPDCDYLKSSGAGNRMPIAINNKRLKKWIENSDQFLLESIDIQ